MVFCFNKKAGITGHFVCYEFFIYLIVEENSFGPKPIPGAL